MDDWQDDSGPSGLRPVGCWASALVDAWILVASRMAQEPRISCNGCDGHVDSGPSGLRPIGCGSSALVDAWIFFALRWRSEESQRKLTFCGNMS